MAARPQRAEIEIETVGLVLRRFDYGDSSQIAHVLTPADGRISLLAKGVKKPNPYLRGPLDLFQLARIVVRRRRDADLGLLARFEPLTGFPGLRRSLPAIYGAFYLCELVYDAVQDGQSEPEIFQLVARALAALEDQRPGAVSAIVIAGELGILARLGLSPALTACAGCGVAAPGGSLLIRPEAGGWICRDCGTRSGRAFELAAGDLRLLRSLERAGPGHAGRLRLSAEQHRRLRRLMDALVEVGFEKRFRSAPFVMNAGHGRPSSSVLSGRLGPGQGSRPAASR